MTVLGSAKLMAFVSTQNPDQAKNFYENALGLRLLEDQPFAVVFDANGTILRVAKVEQLTPVPYTVLGWVVDNIADAVNNLKQNGVIFERYEGFGQDELGI